MNQDPNSPSQLSAESRFSTAEAETRAKAARENVYPAIDAATAHRGTAAEGGTKDQSENLSLPPVREGLSFDERCEEVMRVAQEAFSQTGSWVIFYREILGHEGIVRKLFVKSEDEVKAEAAAAEAAEARRAKERSAEPGAAEESAAEAIPMEVRAAEELRRFEETSHYGSLLEMAAALRSQDTGKGDEFEPLKMITVRLPMSQHETLKKEAVEHETSINKLCISKLLLPIECRLVPVESGKVRGRKPGPQGSRNQRLSETEDAT